MFALSKYSGSSYKLEPTIDIMSEPAGRLVLTLSSLGLKMPLEGGLDV
jgi:hypothetical protein